MQILITHGSLAQTRAMQFNRMQLGAAVAALALVLIPGSTFHGHL